MTLIYDVKVDWSNWSEFSLYCTKNEFELERRYEYLIWNACETVTKEVASARMNN